MKDLLLYFLDEIKMLNEKEHAEKFIEYLLSPVITGIKPSSTITLKNCKRNLYDYWRRNGKEILKKHKLNSMVLKNSRDGIVLLVYDKKNLHEHLNVKNNCKLLSHFGYGNMERLDDSLEYLKDRAKKEEFPHESGIFLGIPYEDVLGFINGEEYLFTGHWKVYTDKYSHKKIFDLYDKSKEIYILNALKNRENNIKDLYVNQRRSLYKYDN